MVFARRSGIRLAERAIRGLLGPGLGWGRYLLRGDAIANNRDAAYLPARFRMPCAAMYPVENAA
jgi:hypothetical protein